MSTKKQTSMERAVAQANEGLKRKASIARFKRNPAAEVARVQKEVNKLAAEVAAMQSKTKPAANAKTELGRASAGKVAPRLRPSGRELIGAAWDKMNPQEKLEAYRKALKEKGYT
jgi:hypothetical protein